MAKRDKYRTHIENLIKEYSRCKPSYGDIEAQMIFDREHDHYQLVNIGWHDHKRIRGCVLHIDIKESKIWIPHDGTEDGIANDFVALGVPKEDIVLAYHIQYRRQHTGFAVS
jgi:predicted RNA-binding protein